MSVAASRKGRGAPTAAFARPAWAACFRDTEKVAALNHNAYTRHPAKLTVPSQVCAGLLTLGSWASQHADQILILRGVVGVQTKTTEAISV